MSALLKGDDMQYRVPQTLVCSGVVRIYRSDAEQMVGVVEDVESGRSIPFSSMQEVWDALQSIAKHNRKPECP